MEGTPPWRDCSRTSESPALETPSATPHPRRRGVVDTSTASGRMMAGILAQVAEFEAEVARERILRSFETRRKKAIAEGRDPVDAVRSSPRYGEKEGDDPDAVLAAYRETGSFSKTARLPNERAIGEVEANVA